MSQSTSGTKTQSGKPNLPLVGVATAVLPAVALSSLALAAPATAAPAPRASTAHIPGSLASAMERAGHQASVVPATEIASLVPSRLAPAQAPAPEEHIVARGETITSIAARYGLKVRDVLTLNSLTPSTVIYPGNRIRLAGAPAAPAAPPQQTASPAAPATAGTYTIRPGDTLYGISARLRVPVASLLAANGLSLTSVIYAGKTLKLPDTAAPTASVEPASSTAAAPLVPDTFLGYRYPDAVVASANENKRLLNASPVPSREQMKQIVADTARKMGVDPALALGFAYQESGFNQRAVSPANAIGTMQVIPSSGQWASDLVGRRLNLLDPYDNATAGVAIIRALVRTSKDEDTAIAGYYQGQYSVAKNGMYKDTVAYVAAVKAHAASFR